MANIFDPSIVLLRIPSWYFPIWQSPLRWKDSGAKDYRDVRSKVGPDFPVIIRLSGTDYQPDGYPIEETIVLAKALEKEGIDGLHISDGDYHTMVHQTTPMSLSLCHNVWSAEAIKKEVKVPVIASGSITLPKYAEDILSSAKSDFISLGRPLCADPEWPLKAYQKVALLYVWNNVRL